MDSRMYSVKLKLELMSYCLCSAENGPVSEQRWVSIVRLEECKSTEDQMCYTYIPYSHIYPHVFCMVGET